MVRHVKLGSELLRLRLHIFMKSYLLSRNSRGIITRGSFLRRASSLGVYLDVDTIERSAMEIVLSYLDLRDFAQLRLVWIS